MKTNCLKLLSFGIALLAFSCSTEEPEVQNQLDAVYGKVNKGNTQISGVGFFADPSQCDYEGEGADYALHLTGDLEGCVFVYVESYECSPSGTYRESGREYFVGTYNGEAGTFWTTYNFSGKYEGCSDEGFFLGAEIFGRCQHPITKQTGTGVFEGVTGRLDFKDDVENGNFPYRGHLKL